MSLSKSTSSQVCDSDVYIPGTPILSDNHDDSTICNLYVKPNCEFMYPRTPNGSYIVPKTEKYRSPISKSDMYLFSPKVRKNLLDEFDAVQ